MRVLALTGGGSAGHVVPNLALLPALKDRFAPCYIGTGGIEKKLLAGKGVPFYEIDCPKLVRGAILPNLSIPCRLLHAVRAAKKALRASGAAAVFSKGGYVSLPVVLAARSLGIPAITHESDLTPGLANKLISRRCARVLTAFPETARAFPRGLYVGSPVREELFCGDRAAALAKYGFSGKKPVLLAFGGGSGSATLNEALLGALPALTARFDVLLLAGKELSAEGCVCLPFEREMSLAYACADFVLARAGANTLFEILALRKRALVVPLENKRSRGDQVQNAEYFARAGLIHVLREKELSPASLQEALFALERDGDLTARLAERPRERAAEKIARIVEETCAQNK